MLKKFLVLFLISIIFSGCSHKQACEEINFSTWGSVSEIKILKQLIANYEKENPKVKIKLLHFPQNYFQKIHLLFASNTAPDVVFINNLYLPIYHKYLENLDDLIDKKDFYVSSVECLKYNNEQLAIPRDISNLVIYINLDKMNLPNPNWTIEDLLKEGIKHTNTRHFGISFEEDIYFAIPYLSYFGENLDGNFSFNNSTAIKFYKDLKNKYKIAPNKSQIGSSTLAQMFLDEKIVMYVSGRWMYPKIENNATFNWAVINFPYGTLNHSCDSSGWAINKNSKNKEQAKDFVKYLSSKKSSDYFTTTGLIVPARIESSKLLNNKKHNEKIFLEVAQKSRTNFVDKNYKKLVDNINQELAK